MKSKTTAMLLSVLVGPLGIDRFYLGYTGMGILKLLTGGCFGILWILDIVNISTGKLLPADGSAYEDQDGLAAQRALQAANGAAEELRKYKELLDQGVLSPEEFEAKKQQLLSMH